MTGMLLLNDSNLFDASKICGHKPPRFWFKYVYLVSFKVYRIPP